MKEHSDYIPALHSLRGLASLAVFSKHLFAAPFITVPFIIKLAYFGDYGVQVFFVISGFVLPYSLLKSQYKLSQFFSFFSKRLIRLEPPYLVAVLLATGYLVLGGLYTTAIPLRDPPNSMELALHLGYLVPFFKNAHWVNMAFWTLAIEFQYYLFLGLTFSLITSGNKYHRWIYYSLYILPTLVNEGREMILVCLPIFLLGTVSALKFKGCITRTEFLVMVLVLSLENFYKGNWVVVLFTTGSLSVIHFVPMLTSRVLNFLGTISYSLYLTHFPTAMAVNNFLWHRLETPLSKTVVLLFSIFFGLGIAYLFNQLVENPFKKAAISLKRLPFIPLL